MPGCIYIPAASSWSIPPTSVFPASFAVHAAGGNVVCMASSPVSPPASLDGIVFHVVIDGGAPIDTACLVNGSEVVPIPPGSTTVAVTITRGCNGGGVAETPTVSGAST